MLMYQIYISLLQHDVAADTAPIVYQVNYLKLGLFNTFVELA